MAFGDHENSVEGSAPVELYEFSYLGTTLRYTSADRDVTIGPSTYTQTSISRSAVEDAGDIAKATLTLTVRSDFPPAQLFSVAPPSDVVNLLVKRVHLVEPDSIETIWAGRVLNVSWPSSSCRITCQSLYTSLKQPGLRRPYGRQCPFQLYGSECRVNQLDFQVNAVVTGGQTQLLQSPLFLLQPDGYFSGGKVEIEVSPGVIERRGIREHVGDTLTLTHRFNTAADITTAAVFPGCDHTRTTCIAKFNNVLNFGGFPYMVSKNPFGQNTVF